MDPRRWDQIQAEFDALVELDPTMRARHLEALGATDPALRTAVEALLAADAVAEARLAPLEAMLSPARRADPLGLSGRTISHFRIAEPLGTGGMGVVYRAEDLDLNRPVALKFLLPHLGLDPTSKERFLREARAAAALDHPNLCTIHEVGESADGRPFLAMPLYPGQTLKDRLLKEGPLPIAVAVDIARQIAQGLGCAHAARIVHRDLKPGNVMLLPDGTAKILDFGLARSRDETQSGSSASWGTVAYMAPEQVRGEPVDARTDLWALGVVLYEMVTGRRPFGDGPELARARAILDQEPPPPSQLRADLPAQLEAVILTLLEKDPVRRVDSAASALAALASGPRVGRLGRTRRVRRALRLGLGATAALAGVTIAVWGIARTVTGSPGVPVSPTRVAVFPFTVPIGSEFADLSQGLMDVVSHALDGAGELHTVDPNLLLSRLQEAGAGEAPELERGRRIAEKLGAGHFVLGHVANLQGGVQLSATLYSLGGTEPEGVSTHQGDLKSLTSLIDSVAHDLLTMLPAAQGTFAGAGSGPTASYPALRGYVHGVALMRRLQMDSAATALASAVHSDSLFASAWLALAEARSYEGTNIDSMIGTWDRAYTLRDRLPPRDRAWLLVGHPFAHGDGRAAAKAARAMVSAYPDAAVGWYYLGDCYHYLTWQLGHRITEADSAIARSLQLDPHNQAAKIELAQIRWAEGQKAEGDSLWLSGGANPMFVLPDDSVGRRRFLAALESAPWDTLVNMVWVFAAFTDSLRDVRRVTALLTDPGRAAEGSPGIGHQIAAWVDVAAGRWSAADSGFSRAAALDPRLGIVERAWLAAMPALALDTGTIRRVRAALLHWVPHSGPNTRYLEDWRLSPWQNSFAKLYALGLLSARLGDRAAAERYAAQLERTRPPQDSLGLVHDLALEIRGLEAEQRGDWQTALQILEGAVLRGIAPPAEDGTGPFSLRAFGRLLRAEALYHLGRDQEALDWYGTFSLWTEFVFIAPVQLRMGEIYERQGNPTEAVTRYRRFLARWQDADPQYQPLLRDVATRVARLARSTGGP